MRGDLAYIPLIQRLIEGNGAAEHASHIFNRTDIPLVQRLIETSSAVEHALHC